MKTIQENTTTTTTPLETANEVEAAVQQIEDDDKAADVVGFRNRIDQVVVKVDEIEQRVNNVAHFYSSLNKKQLNISKGSSSAKEKDKQVYSVKRHQQEAGKREAAGAKRMQELIRHFGTIFRQITAHKWAWPFMHPVDVEGLGLDDYYEVIDKPMDFTTIKNQMEAKDGTGYKNVREICADVRLVFKNAMTYNDDRNDVHVMAKTLLAKFEEKWLLLLPKVIEEETRRKEEAEELRLGLQLAQEAANAKMARNLSNELCELDAHLDQLRESVVQKCRKMSADEKRKLGTALEKLSPEDLTKALEIIAQKNPDFPHTAEEVEIDMNTQSESTLWRLKFFVKGALEAKAKDSPSKIGNDNNNNNNNNINNNNNNKNDNIINNNKGAGNENNKRKREICNALVKTAKKRSNKKPAS
ncbi:Transcription factor GTE1 [Ranunculus cassubicifolius]